MSYKKLFIFLLILSLIFTFTGCLGKLLLTTPSVTPPAGTAGILYLDPASLNVSSGESFTADLKVGAINDLKGYSVTLSYDPTLITPQEITEGSFFSSSGETFFYQDINPEEGTILIDCAILGRDLCVSGEGTLATLSFTCLKAGSAPLSFAQAKTRNGENKELVTTKEQAVFRGR
jgi:hypothetical protein